MLKYLLKYASTTRSFFDELNEELRMNKRVIGRGGLEKDRNATCFESLGEEFREVLADNLWDLYEDSEPQKTIRRLATADGAWDYNHDTALEMLKTYDLIQINWDTEKNEAYITVCLPSYFHVIEKAEEIESICDCVDKYGRRFAIQAWECLRTEKQPDARTKKLMVDAGVWSEELENLYQG